MTSLGILIRRRYEDADRILLDLPTLTFGAIFTIVFVLSGPLTLSGLPYRLSPVALLAFPLVARYRVPIDSVVLVYAGLVVTILISAFLNGSSISQTVLFMRSIVGSFLIYRLVDIYVTPERITSIIRWSVRIAVVQMPIMLMERLMYHQLPAAGRITFEDSSIGTFRDDSSMCFFLVALVIFLLFGGERTRIIRRRVPALLWISLTVLLSNSEISKVALMMVGGAYLIRHFSLRTVVVSVVTAAAIAGVLFATGLADQLVENFTVRVTSVFSTTNDVASYLRGNYARAAAIKYYLSRDILWFGDGPLRYADVITGARMRGNTGHVFTYYSEVGFIGWALSMLVFLTLALRRGNHTFLTVGILAFMSVTILSFTSEVLNHLSIVLTFCIIVKTWMIPIPEEIQLERGQ